MDNESSLPLGEFYVCILYILCKLLAVSLQIATLVQNMLSAMAADYTSQTTMLFYTNCVCAILILVRVLLVT